MAVNELALTNPVVFKLNLANLQIFSFDYANGFEISDSGVKGETNFAIKIVGNEKSGISLRCNV